MPLQGLCEVSFVFSSWSTALGGADGRADRWGEPIDIEAFAEEHGSKGDADDDTPDLRDTVKALTAEIEKRLLSLTINAPDW